MNRSDSKVRHGSIGRWPAVIVFALTLFAAGHAGAIELKDAGSIVDLNTLVSSGVPVGSFTDVILPVSASNQSPGGSHAVFCA